AVLSGPSPGGATLVTSAPRCDGSAAAPRPKLWSAEASRVGQVAGRGAAEEALHRSAVQRGWGRLLPRQLEFEPLEVGPGVLAVLVVVGLDVQVELRRGAEADDEAAGVAPRAAPVPG